MIPTYYEGIPVVTIYYVVTRAIMLAACAGDVAVRVWRGNWHTTSDTDHVGLAAVALVSLCPVLGEIVMGGMLDELLRDLSKRRALSVRAEESRQHPEAGQITIVEGEE